MTGTVRRFENGWGFIQPDDRSKSIFVHHTGIRGEGFRNLQEGDRVSFETEETDRGPKAVEVSLISEAGA